jgi:molybdate transport system ATP-binding protein
VLRCIAGLHRSLQGHIECSGATWFDSAQNLSLSPQRRRVGMVFQSYSLLPHLSALENVALALWHLPFPQRLRQAAEWLARVHLQGLEHRHPATLSGGQQQRVALARALARTIGDRPNSTAASDEPAVLLLDEPFSAVDQVTRRKLQGELARLRREVTIPIVLVTHDLDEARTLADRMVLLHRGVSLQSGPPEQVMTRPASAAIARQVGLSNLFEGRIGRVGASGMTTLVWLGRHLDVVHACAFAAGDRVHWVIPPEGILLHRRDRPSRGDAENPVAGVVADRVPLGPYTQIMLQPDGDGLPLIFSVPTHVAQRNDIQIGAAARVTLLAQAIHLMPWERPE